MDRPKTYNDLTDQEKLQCLEIVLEHLYDAVILADQHGHVLHVNPAWERMTGWSCSEALGKTAGQLMRSDHHPAAFWKQISNTLKSGETWGGRIHSRRRDGSKLIQNVTIIPVPNAERSPKLLGVRQDITQWIRQQTEHQAHIRKLSMHDALTGLPNRALLYDRMEQAQARLTYGTQYAILFFDVDRFRLINDSLGHTAANGLLLQIADRLRGSLGSSDSLARLNGDEFAVLLEDNSLENIWNKAHRLHTAFETPFEIGDRSIVVRVSTGIALGEHGTQAREVLRDAERAMFRAKQACDGRLVAFSPEMTNFFSNRMEREQSLRRALQDAELTAWFQPQIRLSDGLVVGFEALARWPGAKGRHPGEFIPLAEQTGLIHEMGRAILDRTCHFAAQHPALNVAFNLSPLQFQHPDVLKDIEDALARHNVEPHRLEIEITESAAMQNAAHAVSVCHEIKRIGLKLSIDDFGTGYSSLSQLHQLPAERLKIDRSFVQHLGKTNGSLTIVRAILGMSHSLGLETVAEGIETYEQYKILCDEGCELGQGWLFSKALPAKEALLLCNQNLAPPVDKS